MTQFPKISIVTPSFNQGNYLEETILSVIQQEYPNIEFIIIDGGSTDNSIEIIKKYEKHLAYWISEKDNGMYDAIQKGFEKSTGKIMAWINSDDWYHKKSFFTVAEIFSNFQNVEWLQGLPSIVDEAGRTVHVHDFREWSKYDFLRGDYEFIQQESCFWRRSLWEKAGGKINATLKYAGDFGLWLTFFDYAELYCIHAILGGFRVRSKNQLSLERRMEYMVEVNNVLKVRKDNLLAGERKHLIRLALYRNVISQIPVLEKIYERMYIEEMYPQKIFFDRLSQRFKMKEKEPFNFYDSFKSLVVNKFKSKNSF